MKIQRHPHMQDIAVGDEVLSYRYNLYARVEEVFPAAVCVKLTMIGHTPNGFETREEAQLWRADEIENLSRCCYCGARDDLVTMQHGQAPQRICSTCRSVLQLGQTDVLTEVLTLYGQARS